MTGKNLPLIIAALVVVLGLIGGIVLVASPDGSMDRTAGPHVHDDSHSHESDGKAVDTIIIKGFAYEPVDVKIKVGDTITWTNQDDTAHTVTSAESAPAKIDSGLFGKGESFSYTFKDAGRYDYYCMPHPYMKASIVVE